jgi:hypothetical protein
MHAEYVQMVALGRLRLDRTCEIRRQVPTIDLQRDPSRLHPAACSLVRVDKTRCGATFPPFETGEPLSIQPSSQQALNVLFFVDELYEEEDRLRRLRAHRSAQSNPKDSPRNRSRFFQDNRNRGPLYVS